MLRALAVVLLISTVGCGPDPDNECMKRTKGGACVTVLAVEPHYLDGHTSNVDAWQSMCEVPDPVNPGQYMLEPEMFTDHMAAVTIANILPVGEPRLGPTVTFDTYMINFKINECARDLSGAGAPTCPNISPIELQPGTLITIPVDGTATLWLPLVPLRKKFEYQERLSLPGAFSSYTAEFTLGGTDQVKRFDIQASAEFSIGNYDNCASLE